LGPTATAQQQPAQEAAGGEASVTGMTASPDGTAMSAPDGVTPQQPVTFQTSTGQVVPPAQQSSVATAPAQDNTGMFTPPAAPTTPVDSAPTGPSAGS